MRATEVRAAPGTERFALPHCVWRVPAAAFCFALVACLAWAIMAVAAPNFPALSGRIVDDAGIVPAASSSAIEPKLKDLEDKSGIQFVVATVKSLDGEEIEPYANELFRAWQLGQKTKNNGVLLLVAPNEHKVRIEVGYGLEGTLTDALSKVVITNAIAPRFKTGDFGGGIERGVEDVITILTTDASEWQQKPSLRLDNQPENAGLNWIIVALAIAFLTGMIISPGFRWLVLNIVLNLLANSGRGGGYSSGGGGFSSGGGGFSGGGGSSGGGGASGSW